ncbi:MAG: hypothetical protein ACR2M3_07380 [Thermomicrobiales bacterium]
MRHRLLIAFAAVGVLLFGLAAYDAGAHHAFSPTSLAAADDCQTFPQTGKTVCGDFLTYWRDHGGLAQQGYPISDVFDEKSDTDGITHKVQYFERAVVEAHPENQPPNTILLSLLGSQKYAAKYPGGTPGASPAAATAATAMTAVPTSSSPATTTAMVSGVTFLSVQGSTPGGAASVAIKGPPSAQCAITFTTPAGAVSAASGLGPKTTTTAGLAVWSWTIDSSARSGTGTVLMQCSGGVSATTSIKVS